MKLPTRQGGSATAERGVFTARLPARTEVGVRGDAKIPEQARPVPDAFAAVPRVSIVVPALNEERNLPHVLPRIPHWVHEVLLVDGQSMDRTLEVARQLFPGIRVVTQEGRGKGAALRSGFSAATGDIIVTLDADGSADPAEIPAFVGVLMTGVDFVKGSRFLQGGGTADMELHRRLGNWVLRVAAKIAFGGRFSDLCYGYNAFWSDLLPQIAPDVDGFEIETQMNLRALRYGLKVAEIPSFEGRRIHGSSRLRALRDGWRVLGTIARERLRRVPRDSDTNSDPGP